MAGFVKTDDGNDNLQRLTIHLESFRVKCRQVEFSFAPMKKRHNILPAPEPRITCCKVEKKKNIIRDSKLAQEGYMIIALRLLLVETELCNILENSVVVSMKEMSKYKGNYI